MTNGEEAIERSLRRPPETGSGAPDRTTPTTAADEIGDSRPPAQQLRLIDDRTTELLIKGAHLLMAVVYVVVLATFAILATAFALQLFGASRDAGFVDWVFRNSERSMEPFRGMFPVEELGSRSVFDASLLFAAAFYGFAAIGLHALVAYLSALARSHRQRHPTRDDSAPRG